MPTFTESNLNDKLICECRCVGEDFFRSGETAGGVLRREWIDGRPSLKGGGEGAVWTGLQMQKPGETGIRGSLWLPTTSS